jgi:hypothetical protein
MTVNGNLATPDFILSPSAFILIERHAKINEAGRLKPIACRHIRGGFNSDFDFPHIECLRRHKSV